MRLPTAFFDVFCLLMGIFMLFNQMLAAYFNESPEKTLPEVDLAAIGTQGGAGMINLEAVTITIKAQSSAPDGVTYFVNQEETRLSRVSETLRAFSPGKVTLRVDKDIPHGLVLEVIDMCQRENIENINFSYKGHRSSQGSHGPKR